MEEATIKILHKNAISKFTESPLVGYSSAYPCNNSNPSINTSFSFALQNVTNEVIENNIEQST